MLSLSLISSLCLPAVSFRASTCPFNLSASALCFSASRCHSDSHLDHCSLLSAHLCLRTRSYSCSQYATQQTNNNGVSDHTKLIVGYLVLRSNGWSTWILPLSPCSIMILWFSFLSSKISCWAWVMASHGLAGLGPPGGTDVTPGFIQEMGGCVPGTWTPLCAPADWTLDAKCDGGTRSFWISPT